AVHYRREPLPPVFVAFQVARPESSVTLHGFDDVRGDVVGQSRPINTAIGGTATVVRDQRLRLVPVHLQAVQHDLLAIVSAGDEWPTTVVAGRSLADGIGA